MQPLQWLRRSKGGLGSVPPSNPNALPPPTQPNPQTSDPIKIKITSINPPHKCVFEVYKMCVFKFTVNFHISESSHNYLDECYRSWQYDTISTPFPLISHCLCSGSVEKEKEQLLWADCTHRRPDYALYIYVFVCVCTCKGEKIKN